MSNLLTERLNQILPRITSDDFLSGSGIGNEIAFYIFDYPPEDELRVREHIQFLLEHIPKQKPDLRVIHINCKRRRESAAGGGAEELCGTFLNCLSR